MREWKEKIGKKWLCCGLGLIMVFVLFCGICMKRTNATVTESVRRMDSSIVAETVGQAENGTAADESEKNRTARELYALSAVLMDADNGRILLEKNGNQVLPMASTTKIMTCILTLEMASLEDHVSVSAYAAKQPKVHLGVQKGEVFQLRDLMYSLMLESHNDSAVIIAEHVGNVLLGTGKRSAENTEEESRASVLAFTNLMNAKAEEIGCGNTFFVTPNGLDGVLTFTDPGGNSSEYVHSTTAADLARIMCYCIQDSPQAEAFLEITRTQDHSFTDHVWTEDGQWQPGSRSFSCINHNAFLNMMDGVLTGKTGFTGKAGYCYVGALQRGEKTFSIALLACGWPNHKTWKWHDAKALYEYGLEHYEKKDIFVPYSPEPLKVEDGVETEAELVLEQEEISLLLSEEDEVSVEVCLDTEEGVTKEDEHGGKDVSESIHAPVQKGITVGRQNYYVNGELYVSLPIRTAASVDKITYRYCLEQILNRFLLINIQE